MHFSFISEYDTKYQDYETKLDAKNNRLAELLADMDVLHGEITQKEEVARTCQ